MCLLVPSADDIFTEDHYLPGYRNPEKIRVPALRKFAGSVR